MHTKTQDNSKCLKFKLFKPNVVYRIDVYAKQLKYLVYKISDSIQFYYLITAIFF